MIRKRNWLLRLIVIAFLCVTLHHVQAQEPPFWNEVKALIQEDVQHPKPRKEILFAGSSSFRLWKNADKSFANKTIVNVGFGGSTLLDQIRYFDYIILPYQPSQVVIYCGENDIAYDSLVDGKVILSRVKKLIELIRANLPKTHISFVSIKPSPSREKYLPIMKEGNQLIQEYMKGLKRASYINVFDEMLDSSGKPKDELFLDDKLHMNEEGYKIWVRVISPHLK